RHKPGRRCLIEYTLASPEGSERVLLGKIRAKGVDSRTFHLMQQLRIAGLDGIHSMVGVPEPVAELADLNMWVQRKVSGTPAITALLSVDATTAARRIASSLHALHAANVAARKGHGLSEEIEILRQ